MDKPKAAGELIVPRSTHGLKARLGPHLLESTGWRELKNRMKDVALIAQWQSFLQGEADPRARVADALSGLVDHPDTQARRLSAKATSYAKRKAGQRQYVIHHRSGAVCGSKFRPEGTTMDSPIYRTAEGTRFRLPIGADTTLNATIEATTGQPWQREDVLLGQGDFGVVQLAETLTNEGRRDGVLAAKLPIQGRMNATERQSLKHEIGMLARAPKTPFFPETRESYRGKKTQILLQELAIGGDCQALHARVIQSPLERADKHRILRSLTQNYVEAVAQLFEHEPPIHHRDVKERNFLVVQKAHAPLRIMLSDFGSATMHGTAETESEDRNSLHSILSWMRCPQVAASRVNEQMRNLDMPLRDVLKDPWFGDCMSASELTEAVSRLQAPSSPSANKSGKQAIDPNPGNLDDRGISKVRQP